MDGVASAIEWCVKPAAVHLSSIQSRIHGYGARCSQTLLLNPQLVVCAGTLFAVLPVLELNPHRSDCLNNPFTSKTAREYIPRTWQELVILEQENMYREGLRFRIFNLLEVSKTSESHESMCTAACGVQSARLLCRDADAYGFAYRTAAWPKDFTFTTVVLSCIAKYDKIWMATAN
jgi:hypothetical protein